MQAHQFVALTAAPEGLLLRHHQQQHHHHLVSKVSVTTTYASKRPKKSQGPGKPTKKRRVQNRPRPENTHTGRWTKEEHAKFLEGIKLYGKEWKKIASMIETRTVVQIRTHAQKYFQKLAKKKAQESGRAGGGHAVLKSVATKKKGSRRKSSRDSHKSGNGQLLSLLLPSGSSSRKTSAHGARESPTSVADLNFHFTKHSGSSGGTYPDSASNLFSGDLASEPDVPLTNWLNDVNDVMKNDSDSSDCCSFLAPGEQMIYADTNADQWDDPWDFDPAAFVTGSLLVGDT